MREACGSESEDSGAQQWRDDAVILGAREVQPQAQPLLISGVELHSDSLRDGRGAEPVGGESSRPADGRCGGDGSFW